MGVYTAPSNEHGAVLIGCTGLFLLALLQTLGCVERTITVQSDPAGALVYLNEEEIGRTPVKRDFSWYGTYSVAVRKPGYLSIKTKADVPPPFYQWPPFDLIAELIPFEITDSHELNYTLELQPAGEDNEGLLDRALSARCAIGIVALSTDDAGDEIDDATFEYPFGDDASGEHASGEFEFGEFKMMAVEFRWISIDGVIRRVIFCISHT